MEDELVTITTITKSDGVTVISFEYSIEEGQGSRRTGSKVYRDGVPDVKAGQGVGFNSF